MKRPISRRDFMKLTGLSLGALALRPYLNTQPLPQFPKGDKLGRVAVQPNYNFTMLRPSPNENDSVIRQVAQDEVVVWQREVIGTSVSGRTNRTWVETPDGYIYAPDLQPVRNLPNAPVTGIPGGKNGFWAEVTVPYVNLGLLNPPARSPAIKYLQQYNQPIRLYYGQVVWIDAVGADSNGTVLYRFNEDTGHGYGYGDVFLGEAAAFKVLTADDVSQISPNVDPATKKITIDATPGRQTLSCFEGNSEVYFCRISSGYGEKFSTPTGDQAISWKIFSIHMAANTGSDSGYDTMGVPWPVFFNQPAGAAIHGVFWHNDFGVRRSHGCVNVSPEDAKWIYRWTMPFVSLDQSEWRTTDWTKVGGAYSTAVSVSELQA
ncbi:MAG TPA: L,D-transpeptidase [Anaerolineales bacterium]|nr:L,D-transpeptidase [Anaerolineales bacterium]